MSCRNVGKKISHMTNHEHNFARAHTRTHTDEMSHFLVNNPTFLPPDLDKTIFFSPKEGRNCHPQKKRKSAGFHLRCATVLCQKSFSFTHVKEEGEEEEEGKTLDGREAFSSVTVATTTTATPSSEEEEEEEELEGKGEEE